MSNKVFFDSNILVYLSNEQSSFHKSVVNNIKELVEEYELFISVQVLREYAVVMSREKFYAEYLLAEQITDDLMRFHKMFNVLEETIKVNRKFISILKDYEVKGKRIHDANIVATMLSNGIKKIFTYNVDDFKSFKEIEIIK